MGGVLHVYPPAFVVSPLQSCSYCYNCPAPSPYIWFTPVCHPAFHSGLIFPKKPSSGPFLSWYGWHSRDCLLCGDRNSFFFLSFTAPQSQEQIQEMLVGLRWDLWLWSTCSIDFSSPTKPSMAPHVPWVRDIPNLFLCNLIYSTICSHAHLSDPQHPRRPACWFWGFLSSCCHVLDCFVIHPSWVCF